MTSAWNDWHVATLATGVAVVLAAGGCASGPEVTDDTSPVMAATGGDEADATGQKAGAGEGADEVELVEVATDDDTSEGAAEPQVEEDVVAVAEVIDDASIESTPVEAADAEVGEAEETEPDPADAEPDVDAVVEVEEIIEEAVADEVMDEAPIESTPDEAADAEVGDAEETESDPADAEPDVDAVVEVDEVIEEIDEEAVVELPPPTFELVLDLAGDEADIGRRLIQTFVATGTASPVTGNLAAATATRLTQGAEAGRPVRTVRLHRVSLLRDQVAAIPGAVNGAEVLASSGTGGFAQVLGAEAETIDPWKRVRSYRSAGDRPLLIWDRRANPAGWSGWVVVLTR